MTLPPQVESAPPLLAASVARVHPNLNPRVGMLIRFAGQSLRGRDPQSMGGGGGIAHRVSI